MPLFLIIVFYVCNFFITVQAATPEKLIFAIDFIRHGDRTPTADLPNAPYHWQDGLGQLTAIGMQQEYLLGTRLRKIYVDQYHLLSSNYHAKEIYVRSSDADRTLMSAQAFLLGLYPLGTGPALLGSTQSALPQAFQPVPIHTVAKDQENLLIAWTESLKFKEYLKMYIYPTAAWQKKTAELKPKFAPWSEATGIHITDLYQLKSLGDTLYIDQLYHVPLPKNLTLQEAKQIIAAGHWVFVTIFQSSIIGKNTGNSLLKTITNYLQQAAQKQTPLKYILFSSHDSTQFSLMSAMSVPLNNTPPYASNLNFSLFESGKNYYVKIKYNDQPVMIPRCGGDTCSLAQFKILVNA